MAAAAGSSMEREGLDMSINNPKNTEFAITEEWCYARSEKKFQAWKYNEKTTCWKRIGSSSSIAEMIVAIKQNCGHDSFSVDYRFR